MTGVIKYYTSCRSFCFGKNDATKLETIVNACIFNCSGLAPFPFRKGLGIGH